MSCDEVEVDLNQGLRNMQPLVSSTATATAAFSYGTGGRNENKRQYLASAVQILQLIQNEDEVCFRVGCRNRHVSKEMKREKAQRLRRENKEGQNDDTNVLRPKVTVFGQNGDGEGEGRVFLIMEVMSGCCEWDTLFS